MNLLASLRYLAALDEHKHFGRAAQACNITQPALSNALRALEDEFGAAIVVRGRSFVGFTEEGERVLASARRMLHEREILKQQLDSSVDSPRGHLTIGVVPTAVSIAARFAAMLHARHPGITPVVLSLNSHDIETRLENLSLDMALGYTERLSARNTRLTTLPQYTERYFLVRRAAKPSPDALRFGPPMTWADAAKLPLCLLTPDMHSRTRVDAAFAAAGVEVQPVMETNSMLTLALTVVVGEVCSVLAGALVCAVQGYRELEALPLTPDVETPVGFMMQASDRPSRTLEAAMALAAEPAWLRHAADYSAHPQSMEGRPA
jgi:DNA-binding transcriptional LysR family regulator